VGLFSFRCFILVIALAIVATFTYLHPASAVLAHEQYVLTQKQLDEGFAASGINVLSALDNPENLKIAFFVGLGIIALGIFYFFFQYSKIGKKLDKLLLAMDPVGHVFLRIALAASLIMSARLYSYMGPEIPAVSLRLGSFFIPAMYVIGVLILFGVFTRVASLAGLLILIAATLVYGEYIITYLNYYGEYIALIVFGSYVLSFDNKLFGISKLLKRYKDVELLIIRVTYGISVLYPAITIKFLHPKIIVDIANQYHLSEVKWLFPQDPLLISLGTGMAQVLVGLMIIVGFETRLASFVTFFLYFLSVIYFKEAVWPHYVLLALAAYLVFNNGGKYGLDHWIGILLKKQSV